MDIIVCLDDRGGMSFNRRRQSRDRTVIEDICRLLGARSLWMDARSQALFAGTLCAARVHASPGFLAEAPEHAVCFVEDAALAPYVERIERLLIYRWNRHYPADVYFDLALDHWQLIGREEWPGFSHERITKEEYCR
ncbi:MAG: ribonuclease Z [Peptococcaceae bacterium]|nr:ribonuclease Z [Peptococcaceae bacterium]